MGFFDFLNFSPQASDAAGSVSVQFADDCDQLQGIAGDYLEDNLARFEDVFASEIFAAVNERRSRIGLRRMERIDYMNESAQGHNLYMHRANDFSHANFDGSDLSRGRSLLLRGFVKVAENIAAGEIYPQQLLSAQNRGVLVNKKIVDGWMNSAGHRVNIEMPSFTHSGMAALIRPTNNGLPLFFVTQIFAN